MVELGCVSIGRANNDRTIRLIWTRRSEAIRESYSLASGDSHFSSNKFLLTACHDEDLPSVTQHDFSQTHQSQSYDKGTFSYLEWIRNSNPALQVRALKMYLPYLQSYDTSF